MEDKKYYDLLDFLQNREEKRRNGEYVEWAKQFEEKGGQIFKNN